MAACKSRHAGDAGTLRLRRTFAAARVKGAAACSTKQKLHHLQQCLRADSVRAEATSPARQQRHAIAWGCAKFRGRSRSAAGARAPDVGGAAGDIVAAMPSGNAAAGRRGESRKNRLRGSWTALIRDQKKGCICIGFRIVVSVLLSQLVAILQGGL